LLAGVSALALTVLTVSGIYLLARHSSTIDQLVILTVPSGAAVMLDSTDYGHSPVKLEQVTAGTYTLTITKEGFEPIVQRITISESQPLEYKLRPVAPSEALSLSDEEKVKLYRQESEDRFAKGKIAIPYDDSALYYAVLILGIDSSNQFAAEMSERIRRTLHQNAQAAASRGDLGQAQEIYGVLVEYYPDDQEARMSQIRLEGQVSSRHGEVRDLVRKAEEALNSGMLLEPARASAYFFSKKALDIDRLNERARAIRNQINERLEGMAEQAINRGDFEGAIATEQQIVELFPEDRQARSRLRDAISARQADARAKDPEVRRINGLGLYRAENFADAVPELEAAVLNNRGSPDVVFALARSYMKLGQLDKAASYFRQVQPSDDDVYRSARAALGDIAFQRGDTNGALERYKEARRLGGSTLYPIAALDDRIERIEKKQKEKEAEPVPVIIRVRHQHGGLIGGSCNGPLTVDSTGVRYDGSEHVFSYNLLGVSVRVTGEEIVLQFQKSSQKFKASRADAERFREALTRYQQSAH